jgi:hypothetical protein
MKKHKRLVICVKILAYENTGIGILQGFRAEVYAAYITDIFTCNKSVADLSQKCLKSVYLLAEALLPSSN